MNGRILIMALFLTCAACPAQAGKWETGFGTIGKVVDCANPWAILNCFIVSPILENNRHSERKTNYNRNITAYQNTNTKYYSPKLDMPSRTIQDPRVK